MKYVLKSDRDRIVDGLGVFAAEEFRVFDEQDVSRHLYMKGIPTLVGNLPEGMEMVLVTGEGA